MATDNKARMAQRRAYDKANGIKDTRKRSGNRIAVKIRNAMTPEQKHEDKRDKFLSAPFVAIDSEGFSLPEKITLDGGAGSVYQPHGINLLAAWDGGDSPPRQVSNNDPDDDAGLDGQTCLDFLLGLPDAYPGGIFVIYFGGYDFTHWLKGILSYRQTQELLTPRTLPDGKGGLREVEWIEFILGDYRYRIACQMKRRLEIWRYHYSGQSWKEMDPCDAGHIEIFDVQGFFQSSFVVALDEWLKGYKDLPIIAEGKKQRSELERVCSPKTEAYCHAELKALVALMNALRDGLSDMPNLMADGTITRGLFIDRWYGAGAIAAKMFEIHGVKEHLSRYKIGTNQNARWIETIPPEVAIAAKMAYSGGHIEICKLGRTKETIHHYDINSAYPAHYRNLPSLRNGVWRHSDDAEFRSGRGHIGFTLVKLRWRFPADLPFYPLFFRKPSKSIFYPRRGTGWYWLPEADAAFAFQKSFGGRLEVLEAWDYTTEEPIRPFNWINAYYEKRRELTRIAKMKPEHPEFAITPGAGRPNGMEKAIKLGLNSCYGKGAQQVGGKRDKDTQEIVPPKYFQLEWAGYVTASCRADLMQAAIQNPHAIISFATDGLFSLEPLDLKGDKSKALGDWSYERHPGMTVIMAGIYETYPEDDAELPTSYARGQDKGRMQGVTGDDRKALIAARKKAKAEGRSFIASGVQMPRTAYDDVCDIWRAFWKGGHIGTVPRLKLPSKMMVTMGSVAAIGRDAAGLPVYKDGTPPQGWAARGCFKEGIREMAVDGSTEKRQAYEEHLKPWLRMVPLAVKAHSFQEFWYDKMGDADERAAAAFNEEDDIGESLMYEVRFEKDGRPIASADMDDEFPGQAEADAIQEFEYENQFEYEGEDDDLEFTPDEED